METLVMTAQIILSLSILVGLHELGHLLAAKYFGMRVEQFSIGFPPKLFGVKYGETEYSIGAIPLGGFVKITGMVDESLDTENLKQEPQPHEFRSKPAWQRLIVMMGGIIVNLILGIVIFIGLTYSYGESYIPIEEVNKYGIVAHELGEEVGFQTGDKVLAVNGNPISKLNDILDIEALTSGTGYYTVERNGERLDLSIPSGLYDKLSSKEAQGQFIEPAMPFKVGKIQKGSEAERGGLKEGDFITAIEGQPVRFFQELKPVLDENAGEKITLEVERKEEGSTASIRKTLEMNVSEEGTLGFHVENLLAFEQVQYPLGQSIAKGTGNAFETLYLNVVGLGKMFSGEISTKSMKGPIGIAQMFGGTWNWEWFWKLTGILSMWLAFMNFIPIPALDGGHVAFLSYEMISGRKPSDTFLETAQKIGMVLLLALMVFVIFNDVFNTFF
jgi:regulator of sigma E protease